MDTLSDQKLLALNMRQATPTAICQTRLIFPATSILRDGLAVAQRHLHLTSLNSSVNSWYTSTHLPFGATLNSQGRTPSTLRRALIYSEH